MCSRPGPCTMTWRSLPTSECTPNDMFITSLPRTVIDAPMRYFRGRHGGGSACGLANRAFLPKPSGAFPPYLTAFLPPRLDTPSLSPGRAPSRWHMLKAGPVQPFSPSVELVRNRIFLKESTSPR